MQEIPLDTVAVGYWRAVFDRTNNNTIAFIRQQSLPMRLAPALLIPIFLFLEFSVGGWRIVAESTIALVESYALAFVGVYAWKFYGALPALMGEKDQTIAAQSKTITDRDEQIKSLQPDKSAAKPQSFWARIEQLQFNYQQPLRVMEIVAQLEIRNLREEKSTLHDFALHLHSGELIAREFNRNNFPVDEPIERGIPKHCAIAFRMPTTLQQEEAIQKLGNRWQVSFKDFWGDDHESEMFTYQHARRVS